MDKALLLFLYLFFLTAPCIAAESRFRPDSWGTPIISENLQNWYKVDSLVYRSEQPDSNGMADIERFGIRRVLNLRQFHDDDDEVKGTKLETFHLPMNAANITDEDIVTALKIIKSSNKPILVHCWHGSDRTGTLVAMYRIVAQGWSKEAALDELVAGGYGFHSVYGNIKDYILNVNVDAIKKQLTNK